VQNTRARRLLLSLLAQTTDVAAHGDGRRRAAWCPHPIPRPSAFAQPQLNTQYLRHPWFEWDSALVLQEAERVPTSYDTAVIPVSVCSKAWSVLLLPDAICCSVEPRRRGWVGRYGGRGALQHVGAASFGLLAAGAVPDARRHALDGELTAELAKVARVLAGLHLLGDLTQRRAVARACAPHPPVASVACLGLCLRPPEVHMPTRTARLVCDRLGLRKSDGSQLVLMRARNAMRASSTRGSPWADARPLPRQRARRCEPSC
jgi:hypothetical protein